jgi:hypothetical protein
MSSKGSNNESARYQALKAEVERLGYKVEDVPRLLEEMKGTLKIRSAKAV